MKHILALAALMVVYGVLAAPSAAQPGEGRPGPNPERRQRLLEEFDADDDGQLSDEERARAREVMRDRRRDDNNRGERRFDGRGPGRDGQPSDRPRREGPPEGRPQPVGPPEGRGRPDVPRRGLGGPPTQFIDPRALFEQFDENNDDQLSREEFLSLSVEVMKLRSERIARMGPPAMDRGSTRPGFFGDRRQLRVRAGRPDFRGPGRDDREGRDRPERRGRPPVEEATGAGIVPSPTAEAPI